MNLWRGDPELVLPYEEGQINKSVERAIDKISYTQTEIEKSDLAIFIAQAKLRHIPFSNGVASRDALEYCKIAAKSSDYIKDSILISAQVYILTGEKSLARKKIEEFAPFIETKELAAPFISVFAQFSIFSGDFLSAQNYLSSAEEHFVRFNDDTLLHQEIIFYQAVNAYLSGELHTAEELIELVESYFRSDFGGVSYNYLLTRALLLKLLLIDTNKNKLQKEITDLLRHQDKEVAIALEAFIQELMVLKQ
ncbi:hypothetical protein HY844_01905 [Candidatus Berkelbacteria bacterium]|nr:hypothetical protein [Candidatus Berkelbacteria bacterium]